MITADLLKTLSTTTDIEINNVSTMEDLSAQLSIFIHDLLKNDYQRLLNILYRVDVKESLYRKAFEASSSESIANEITALIIDRTIQKIEFKKKFSSES